jgi:bifunctional UDP-N-acetylglucosamine pyrophosphorylase/glucosamine-1-phosphate N-acetyltransferase
MQAVILAAGEGKRMRPLTLMRPKPLIEVSGRPVIEHILDALPKEVDDVIIVVGYKGDMIRAHLGDAYNGRRVRYVEQKEPLGTAHALDKAREFLPRGRFLLMYADDIHGAQALQELLTKPRGVLVAEHPLPERFGVVSVNPDWTVEHIEEKPEKPRSNLVNTGPMLLDEHIFDFPAPTSPNGEHYVTDSFAKYTKEYPAHAVLQPVWIPLGYPEDIEKAEKLLREQGIEEAGGK